MVDGDPDLPMKDLYEQFVGPISSNRPKLFGKPQVRSAIRKSLRELHVPDSDVVMDPPILGIHGESRLDLGVLGTNGHSNQLVMALEPISFAISSQLEILRQRDHVAWVRSDLTQQLAICAVVTPPIANNKVLFDTSLKLLADVDVSVIDVDDVDTLQTTLAHAGASMIEPSLESE